MTLEVHAALLPAGPKDRGRLTCVCAAGHRRTSKDPAHFAAMVATFLDEHRGCKARSKSSPSARLYAGETTAQKRERKHSESEKRMAALRAVVMARASGRCEACMLYAGDSDPLELDHLVMGAGKRRVYEMESTVWMIHRSCHRARHAGHRMNGVDWMEREADFLARHRYPVHPLIRKRWQRATAGETT